MYADSSFHADLSREPDITIGERSIFREGSPGKCEKYINPLPSYLLDIVTAARQLVNQVRFLMLSL